MPSKKPTSDQGDAAWPAEFLEVALRGELIKPISLGQGTSTGDGRLMERERCPG